MSKTLLDISVETVATGQYKVSLDNFFNDGIIEDFVFSTEAEALEFLKEFVSNLKNLSSRHVQDRILVNSLEE